MSIQRLKVGDLVIAKRPFSSDIIPWMPQMRRYLGVTGRVDHILKAPFSGFVCVQYRDKAFWWATSSLEKSTKELTDIGVGQSVTIEPRDINVPQLESALTRASEAETVCPTCKCKNPFVCSNGWHKVNKCEAETVEEKPILVIKGDDYTDTIVAKFGLGFGDHFNLSAEEDTIQFSLSQGLLISDFILNLNNNRQIIDEHSAHISALQKEVEKLKEAQRWIPVSERLPKHSNPVLVIVEGGEPLIAWYNTIYKWWITPTNVRHGSEVQKVIKWKEVGND